MTVPWLRGSLGVDARHQGVDEQGKITLALSKRRQRQHADRKAVEEVFSEAASTNLVCQHAVGPAMTRTLIDSGSAPKRVTPLLQDTKQSTWIQGNSPTSSRNRVPASAGTE